MELIEGTDKIMQMPLKPFSTVNRKEVFMPVSQELHFSSDLELLVDVDMNVVANWTAWDLFGIHSGNVRDVSFNDCKRPNLDG